MAGFCIAIGVGSVLAIPYAFFCRVVILSFPAAPHSILVGSVVGAAFACVALRRKPNRKDGWLIVWEVVAGGATMPVAQLLIKAIGVCPDLFLPPVLLPHFGGVGTVGYLPCERGAQGKRNREREQRRRRAIADRAEEATTEAESSVLLSPLIVAGHRFVGSDVHHPPSFSAGESRISSPRRDRATLAPQAGSDRTEKLVMTDGHTFRARIDAVCQSTEPRQGSTRSVTILPPDLRCAGKEDAHRLPGNLTALGEDAALQAGCQRLELFLHLRRAEHAPAEAG